MTGRKRPVAKPVAVAAVAALCVSLMGGLMTQLGPWYYGLVQPSWNPPDWLFGPAWTLIFAFTALAGVFGWRAMQDRQQRVLLVALFAVNGVLNILWSAIFFRLERPDLAFVDVVLLWLSIVALIVFLGRGSRLAAWLLAPYLGWVTFAAALNYSIVQLNPSFGRS